MIPSAQAWIPLSLSLSLSLPRIQNCLHCTRVWSLTVVIPAVTVVITASGNYAPDNGAKGKTADDNHTYKADI